MSQLERLEKVREKIRKAAERSRFGARPILLLAVGKGHPVTLVRSIAELGQLDMGENYAQELLAKAPLCQDLRIRWHFVGKLQSNKIRYILPHVTSIQSLDSLENGERIARAREQLNYERPPIPVLLQVNLTNDSRRAGLQPEIIEGIFEQFCAISGIAVSGLMAIPPVPTSSKPSRLYFKLMKELFDRLKQRHPRPELFEVLSMGMSSDFEEAIEEGATCVRIGEAIFGPRPARREE